MKGWRGPKYPGEVPTLGWIGLDWITAHLPSPADAEKPLVFTDEQARIMLRWYALDPLTGRFIYRRGALEQSKGWGKSPMAAAISLLEFAGPCVFDGWDSSGEPVGRPWGYGESPPAWIQIAAVSEDQTDNTYAALYEMLVANEYRAALELGIDQGRTRLFFRDRPGRLEPVTAAAGSREGQRVTFAVLDETHLWTPQSGGAKLARTLRRNAAKMGGRTFETTNAPIIGEKSVAEMTGADAEDGQPGILHIANRPSVEPMEDWGREQLLGALDEVLVDSYWVDRERMLEEIADPATPWEDARRFYFNLRTVGAGRAVDPRRWAALEATRDVPRGTRIGLGFDGSVSRDSTFLRGCTADGYGFIIESWQRTKDSAPNWSIDRTAVDAAIARAFEFYSVGKMIADPPWWQTELEGWQRTYGEEVVEPLWTNQASRFAPAVGRWLAGIREGTHTHDGDALTAEHVKAARLAKVRQADTEDDERTRYVLKKGDDKARIDGAIADVLAYEAAMTMPTPVSKVSPYETRGIRTINLDGESPMDEDELDEPAEDDAEDLVGAAPGSEST